MAVISTSLSGWRFNHRRGGDVPAGASDRIAASSKWKEGRRREDATCQSLSGRCFPQDGSNVAKEIAFAAVICRYRIFNLIELTP
jgi:hypothetical protein